MNADRTRTRGRTSLAFAGLFAAVMGVSLVTLPGHASAAPTGHDHGDCRGDCDHGEAGHGATPVKPQAPKGEDKAKKDEHGGHAPELPNIAYAIAYLAPDTAAGKFFHDMSNWYVVRPIFALLVVVFFLLVTRSVYRRRSARPGRLQVVVEMAVEALDNLVCGILGKEVGRAYLPYLGGLFLYILCLNLLGLFPLGMSPTAGHGFLSTGMLIPTTTTALALCTLAVTQYTAVRKLGLKGMVVHWCGSPTDTMGWIIGVVFMPLHIFSDFVIKPLSLLLRLFGNIYGEDVLLGSMLMLGIGILAFLPNNGIPVGFPLHLPFMFLATLTSTIQALVFTLLSTIYIMMVLPHGDHEHDEHHHEAHAHS